jgi:hypothetical protein
LSGIGVSEANGVVEQSELAVLTSIVSEDIYNEQSDILTNLKRLAVNQGKGID